MKESLTVKTDRINSFLWNAIILGPTLLLCGSICYVLPMLQPYRQFIMPLLAISFIFAYWMSVSNEQGVLKCIPADDTRGARIHIELKRNTYEVFSIKASDVRFRQLPGERKRNVCRVDFPKERIHLRGVCDADKLRRWIETNFA